MAAIGILYEFGALGYSTAGFAVAFLFYFFSNLVWNRLGGWPEAWFRARGITYRQFYIILPNRRIGRFLKQESELKIGSAARVEIEFTKDKTGDYFVPTRGEEMFNNPAGAPAGLYNFDDARAIPLFGREPDALKANGEAVPKAKVDPFLVHGAFRNKFLEERAHLNVKTSKLKWGVFGFLIALTMILEFAVLYEVILYGVNMNCALHTKACP